MAAVEGEKKGAMAAAEGEKKGAMEAEKGAPVEEKRKGEEGAVASEEDNREAATEKGKGVVEAKEVAAVKMITVESLDGETRSMSVEAAKLSVLLRGMISDDCADGVIKLPIIATGRTLDTVIEYCTKHAAEPVKSDCDPSVAAGSSSSNVGAVNDWDRKLVKDLSVDDLHDLLLVANFLGIEGLLGVVCEMAADMIKGKTTQQIRDTFNLPDDLTPADVEELSQQFAWGFYD